MHKRSVPSTVLKTVDDKRRHKCIPPNRRPPSLSALRNALAGDDLSDQLDLVQIIHQYVQQTDCQFDHLSILDVEQFYNVSSSQLKGFECKHRLYNREDVLYMGSLLHGTIHYLSLDQLKAIDDDHRLKVEANEEANEELAANLVCGIKPDERQWLYTLISDDERLHFISVIEKRRLREADLKQDLDDTQHP